MKLTAQIKRKTAPLAKLVRLMSSRKQIVIIDPMGDVGLIRRFVSEAHKSGRLADVHCVKVNTTRSN